MGGEVRGPSWFVAKVMVDPFMRIKGHLEVPWLGEGTCWGAGGAFRREKAVEVPVMVMVMAGL